MVSAISHSIEGDLVPALAEDPVLDPSTGSQIAAAPADGGEEALRAVRAAQAAATEWRHSTPAERAGPLLALADAIAERSEEFAAIEALDVGKPIRTAREELQPGAGNPGKEHSE